MPPRPATASSRQPAIVDPTKRSDIWPVYTATASGGTIARSMSEHPGAAPVQTASELKAQIEAEREGVPFLVYRDTVGRAAAADISVDWDTEVSRIHAELERMGGDWTVADDGLSRNGTHVNGERVVGRRRLRDRDVIRFGQTVATYRQPLAADATETVVASNVLDRASLSDAQRRVIVALCRPFKDSAGYVTPATNQQIADELFLSVDAVKTHLRALFAKFGIEDLPQNQKRIRLVELA